VICGLWTPAPRESRRRQRQRVGRGDLVAGDLPLEKSVLREVVVDGPHDEVTVRPGVGPVVVMLEAVALGEADDVEPVPRPPLAVRRADDSSLSNDALVGIGRLHP